MMENIADDLQNLIISIDSIRNDPANAREAHDLEGIADSLHKYGQRKPIVVNAKTMTIEAGNGTYQAAKVLLGWQHIAAVQVDDDPVTATGYGIADNLLTDKSQFNLDSLGSLLDSLPDKLDVPGVDEEWLSEFLANHQNGANGSGLTSAQQDIPPEYVIIIELSSESEQVLALEQISNLGYQCRALVS